MQTPMSTRRRRNALGYGLFVAMFLVPAIAMTVYLAAVIASASMDARAASAAQEGAAAQADGGAGPREALAWERAALLACPLH